MSKDSSNQIFTPPRNAKPIDPVLRFGMEMNDQWYALIDSLRPQKQQFVEGYMLYSKLHPESEEVSK